MFRLSGIYRDIELPLLEQAETPSASDRLFHIVRSYRLKPNRRQNTNMGRALQSRPTDRVLLFPSSDVFGPHL
jgi:hypothetical protein